MKNEEIIAKMLEIKDIREAEIKGTGIRINVKTFDEIYVDGELPELYLVTESYTDENGKEVEVELYCDQSGKIVGGNNKLDGYNHVLPVGESIQNQDMEKKLNDFKREIEQLEKDAKGMLDLQQLKKELEEIAAAVGKNVDDLGAVEFVTMEELEAAQRELDKYVKSLEDDSKEKKLEDPNKEDDVKDNDLKITPEDEQLTDADFSPSAVMEVDDYVNEYDTIGSTLKVTDEQYTKIAVVSSNQVKDNPNISKYTFVGIRADGTAQIIDSVEPEMDDIGRNDHEITPTGEIDEDEGNRESFRIKGTRYEFTLEGEAGTLEVNLTTSGRGLHGNESLSVPVRTYSTEPNTRRLIELNGRHPDKIAEGLDELSQHDKDCDTRVEDVDGNLDTRSHNDWNDLIESLGDEAKDLFTTEEITKMAEKYWNNGDSEDDIRKKIDSDAYIVNREHGGPNN